MTNNTTITRAAGPRRIRLFTEISCALGAISIIAGGTLLFGSTSAGVAAALVAGLRALWHGVNDDWYATLEVAAKAPWTLIFDVVCGVCVYGICRMIRTNTHRDVYLAALGTAVGSFLLYTASLSPDADGQLAALKGLAVGTLLFGGGAFWFNLTPDDSGSAGSARAQTVWGFITVLAWILFVLTCITGIVYTLNSSDTMPDVSAQVQEKYGAELKRMGFEDVNRESIPDTRSNSCEFETVVFHDGEHSTDVPLMFDHPERWITPWREENHYSQASLCIGMRFRDGKLTMQFPDPEPGTPRQDVVQSALATSDMLMATIRSQYGDVERSRAVKATWSQPALR